MAEKVINIDCTPRRNNLTFAEASRVLGAFDGLMRIGLLIFVIQLLVLFGMGECYRSPALWKRAPLAVGLGLAGAWLLASKFDQSAGIAAVGHTPSLTLLLASGLAAGALILMVLITTEHYMARRTPAWIASYLLAWRGRFGSPAVGLAVLRGTFAGLLLAGLETALYHMLQPRPSWGGAGLSERLGQTFFCALVDPNSVGEAAASFSPALFTVSAALFDAMIIGLVCFGGQWAATYYRELQKHKQKHRGLIGVFALSASATVATLALRLHFASSMVVGLSFLFVPLILFVIPALLFVLYDALSAIVAIGTAVLWTLNYPLLQFFQEVGNGGQWAVFLGWGLLVAAAAAVAFRSELARHLQRAKAEMQ